MLTYWTETWAMKKENLHSLDSVGDGADDGEMDKRNVADGFVQSFGHTECSGCGEAWQIEVVWGSGECVEVGMIGCQLVER